MIALLAVCFCEVEDLATESPESRTELARKAALGRVARQHVSAGKINFE
jgi:hypothetical protein